MISKKFLNINFFLQPHNSWKVMDQESSSCSNQQSTKDSLLTVKDFQKLVPINVRWAIQKHGCRLEEAKVIVRYGRKILIDPEMFDQWLRKNV